MEGPFETRSVSVQKLYVQKNLLSELLPFTWLSLGQNAFLSLGQNALRASSREEEEVEKSVGVGCWASLLSLFPAPLLSLFSPSFSFRLFLNFFARPL